MRDAEKVCKYKKNPVHNNGLVPIMQDTLHKKFVASANKSSVGTLHMNPNKRRKNISYNQHEDYVIEYTNRLMKKHRLGYSGLHKWLILKEAQTQFGIPFV